MENKRTLTLSVHQLVDFLLREGDIDNRVFNSDTMAMGTKIHASYQKKQGERYLSEVALRESFSFPGVDVTLEGRADGIIIGGGHPIIDEIKSTVADLNEFYKQQKNWHFAQAKCYALMYCHKMDLKKAGVRLTYISQIDDSKMIKEEDFTVVELEDFVEKLIEEYLTFDEKQIQHIKARNESAKKLKFPYSSFREGQREMAKYTYSVAKNGGIFFCEAPTGIGKTMSALFPTIKTWGNTDNDKIFYLTAKASGRLSAFDAMGKLYESGLVARDSIITAKEKTCLNPGASCNPDECPFAKGYYSKLRSAVKESLDSDARFSSEYVRNMALRYEMCPFELQLDLSLWADVIILDYNYLFDPIVYLERYFDDSVDSSKYVALIDEAHNLIDRGRNAYSEKITMSMIDKVKNDMRHIKAVKIKNALTKLKNSLDFVDLEDGENKRVHEIPESVKKALESLSRAHLAMSKEKHPSYGAAYADLSRSCHRFSFLNDNFRDETSLYLRRNGSDCSIELYCLDPSPMIRECLEKLKGAIVFSATLSPIGYYMDALVGSQDYPYLLLQSPFPADNFDLMIAPLISTRFKDREKTYGEVAAYLKSFVSSKVGNYFIFFPSYEYLENIRQLLDFEGVDVYYQERDMNDDEKTLFLSRFLPDPDHTSIGLLIIGGSFSEGVDLIDDRLIGVAVVGMGLPQICFEKDIVKEFYERKNGNGFEYAYMNPAVNRVMQAVGRLIRSEKDVGTVLLIDDRYTKSEYRDLFSRVWKRYEIVTSSADIEENIDNFYKKISN